MAFNGFSKNSGPSLPPKSQILFGSSSQSHSPVDSINNPTPPQQQPPRPSVSPHGWGNDRKSPVLVANPINYKRPMINAPHVGAHDAGPKLKPSTFEAPKSTRSLPLPLSTVEVTLRNSRPSHDERSTIALPRWSNQPNSLSNSTNSQIQREPFVVAPYLDALDAGPKFTTSASHFQVPKRTRSPPLPSTDDVILRSSHPAKDDTERETQAKARRLARFNRELSQPMEGLYDLTKKKPSGNKNEQAMEKQKIFVKHTVDEVDLSNGGILYDNEGLEPSSAVVGLCPDMCPESEREERERKGDLDKYERVDGDRNQTSKFLAVKKYNRTAEREANLIRPMPVLQKTVDYLLSLLDQAYDDKFLGIYNFLWDRMRAIRMDLRMQHIFNQDAITMLEQMIRLHIIAMHELCEYTKGEGFAEGFDAHLNIEQMNKASVELFQLYDDHRKKGISIPTEKEFRGYYALLKLDKHPGYKVEPAELSLELAKMTPELRCTSEILFARDVARACRTGNFITFFRLARKATYLQACLMHAHFAKLRTQALASLHSGLQYNKGIPIKQVVKWLGMEEQDIEGFLEYHGFSIKKFEDVYMMMKEGPFLNSNMDYQTKCSQLVALKKSERVIDDVLPSLALSRPNETRNTVLDKMDDFAQKDASPIEMEIWGDDVDEDMPDYEDDSSHRGEHHEQLVFETPPIQGSQVKSEMDELHFLPADDALGHYPPPAEFQTVSDAAIDSLAETSPEEIFCSPHKGMLPRIATGRLLLTEMSGGLHLPSVVTKSAPEVTSNNQDFEAIMLRQKDVVAAAKLRLMLRIWKRRSKKQKEIRELRQLEAAAAFNSLSLGLPVQQHAAHWSHAAELNINHVLMERFDKHVKSWSRLNVSEVVVRTLRERNPDAKCLCWKLIVCSQINDSGGHESMLKSRAINTAGPWLLSKLMGSRNEGGDELAASSGLSICKKWVDDPPVCCLSVIRDIKFDGNRPVSIDDVVAGAGAILFLVSESIPWDLQRARLHNLIFLLPSGSCLPLLILSSGVLESETLDPLLTINSRLSLNDIDKRRISSSSVVFLSGNLTPQELNGFFSDDYLKGGLKWLASHSPIQPVLRKVKTRELVLEYLTSSLEVLENMEISEVGPDHCISAFNDALDHSSEDIITTAGMNPAHWPSPEISLLDEFCDERRAANSILPGFGWSSFTRIKSTVSTIQNCKLPQFATDLSWLNESSYIGREIPNQKLALEECLTWYLTKAGKMMNEELAAREASVAVQRGTGLKFDGFTYCIVPRWLMIFRRLFNWQLMNLTSGPFSAAYVLEHSSKPSMKPSIMRDILGSPLKQSVRKSNLGTTGQLSHHILSELPFDEMVEVSCRLAFGEPTAVVEAVEASLGIDDEGGEVSETNQVSSKGAEIRDAALSHEQGRTNAVVAMKAEGADKLNMLLEQCNILQDMIDEKLALYSCSPTCNIGV